MNKDLYNEDNIDRDDDGCLRCRHESEPMEPETMKPEPIFTSINLTKGNKLNERIKLWIKIEKRHLKD